MGDLTQLPELPDDVLKVWPICDMKEAAHNANAINLEPEPENDFVPMRGKADSMAASACAPDCMEPRFDEIGQISKDMQAASKCMASASENAASSKCVEQTVAPRRFWRDDHGNERDNSTVVDSSMQQSLGLTFDMFGKPLVKEKPPPRKQSRSRGWNLAAEAASKGKRIVPKN